MAGAFSRSWDITKITFEVIKKDKELLLFPIFAGIFSVTFVIAMIFPFILAPILSGKTPGVYTIIDFFLIFIIYLGLAFIATFFNVCVVYTAKKRFEGKNATFFESIKFAFSRIHIIISWSILSAIVGLILRIIDNMAEKMGALGKIMLKVTTSLLGAVWSVITIFVVPGMVYYNLGPVGAIKKSAATLKKTWGESLIRYIGLGFAQFVLLLLGIIVGLMLLLTGVFAGSVGIIVFAITAFIIYTLFVIVLFYVANTVFNTALFVYADKGKIPAGFSKEVMQGAFKKKG